MNVYDPENLMKPNILTYSIQTTGDEELDSIRICVEVLNSAHSSRMAVRIAEYLEARYRALLPTQETSTDKTT